MGEKIEDGERMADDGKQRAEYLITKVGKMGKHEKESF
jgi:hypothetical protein